MPNSVFDYKAINARCREISRHTLGDRANGYCRVCNNLGWVLHPDPRAGRPDVPAECAYCLNPDGLPCPFVKADAPQQKTRGLGKLHKCSQCGGACVERPGYGWYCSVCDAFVA